MASSAGPSLDHFQSHAINDSDQTALDQRRAAAHSDSRNRISIIVNVSSPDNNGNEQHAQGPRHDCSPSRPIIRFYSRGQPYFEFSNFSDHSVRYNGKDYATSEHLFQSLKFPDYADSEHIRLQPSPGAAMREAHKLSHKVRKGWFQENINLRTMEEVLMLKFTQHQDLKDKLLSTGDAILVEDSSKDSFWGIGANGRGRNELGKALERLRVVLKHG